jgi:Trypsin-co-occurring domain 1
VTTVEFDAGDGGSVLVQVTPVPPAGVVTRGIGGAQVVEKAGQSFGKALAAIEAVANGVQEQLSRVTRRPDEVHLEFGLEFTASAGTALLVSGGGSAHLKVEMTWRPGGDAGEGTR